MEERLKWDPHDFSGLSMIRLPTGLLWAPDIVLVNIRHSFFFFLHCIKFNFSIFLQYNSADDFESRSNSEEVRAMIAHTGWIFLGPYVKTRSTCM